MFYSLIQLRLLIVDVPLSENFKLFLGRHELQLTRLRLLQGAAFDIFVSRLLLFDSQLFFIFRLEARLGSCAQLLLHIALIVRHPCVLSGLYQ